MASLNKIQIIGRLGKPPELRFTPSGKAVANFSVAVGDKDKAGKETTTWFNVTAWEKLGERCAEYLHKGSLVYVEGRMAMREYEDKSGVKKQAWDVIAFGVQFLEPKSAKPQAAVDADEGSYQPNDDDVPF